MKKHFITFLFIVAGISPATMNAQNENSIHNKESFEDFRKGIKEGFGNFRKKVLDDYDKYLEGVWQEYNSFRGKEKDSRPKPTAVPMADSTPQTPVLQYPTVPIPEAIPNYKQPEKPMPAIPLVPAGSTKWNTFHFYSLSLQIPEIEIKDCPTGISPQDFAARWKLFSDKQLAPKLIPYFRQTTENCGLNEWFAFELIRTYVNDIFATSCSTLRISLAHYLLVHFGFDARLGLTNSGAPMLLVAVKQDIYERSYTVQDNQKYYIFHDVQSSAANAQSQTFTTCRIPDNLDNGKAIDLLFHREMKMPYAPHLYSFNYQGLKIEGEVNANLMPMLYRYPLMDIRYYAQSVITPNVHEKIAKQLRQQLSGLSRIDAINSLLQFVQSAFQYATDDEQHGFEKPYFFEETLFYPQCDCEDRSIFYSRLLWQVLDAENHLVGYPGHECVAVHLNPPIKGTGYQYEDKSFFISDPTYIGATTGMCMPAYLNERPEIELSR